MKKIIVGVVLLGSITAVAASLSTDKKNDGTTEKKVEKKMEKKKKKSCNKICPFL